MNIHFPLLPAQEANILKSSRLVYKLIPDFHQIVLASLHTYSTL